MSLFFVKVGSFAYLNWGLGEFSIVLNSETDGRASVLVSCFSTILFFEILLYRDLYYIQRPIFYKCHKTFTDFVSYSLWTNSILSQVCALVLNIF